jgi:UDP-N-acetylglucosamine acyltransferase
MSACVHPSSVVHDGAVFGEGVEVGPFCEVGPKVVLGDRVRLHGRVTIMGDTQLGDDCELFPGAVLGHRAQSIGSQEVPGTGLRVGARTVFREHTSVHAGTLKDSAVTHVGSDCYFMAYSHAGHDCQIGNHCVFANACEVGGHVKIGDHVWMGGSVAIHQFTHIGTQAFIAGGAIVVSDVIPFTIAVGNRAHLGGLNLNGLKRRGFSKADMKGMRAGYKAIFSETDQPFAARVSAAAERFADDRNVMAMIEFILKDRSRPLCLPDTQ